MVPKCLDKLPTYIVNTCVPYLLTYDIYMHLLGSRYLDNVRVGSSRVYTKGYKGESLVVLHPQLSHNGFLMDKVGVPNITLQPRTNK